MATDFILDKNLSKDIYSSSDIGKKKSLPDKLDEDDKLLDKIIRGLTSVGNGKKLQLSIGNIGVDRIAEL